MSTKYKTTLLACFFAASMVTGLDRPAHADLFAVGEVDPNLGFPVWYQASTAAGPGNPGTSLALCAEGGTGPEVPPCLLALINPAGPIEAANIEEAFYYSATALGTNAQGASFLGICMVEAAGPGGLTGSVGNVALVRLQDLPVAGDYTATLPCGTFTVTVNDPLVDTDLRGEIAVLGTAPGFATTLLGPVQIFADNGTGAAGFLGDGITPGPLSGPLSVAAGLGGTTFDVTGPPGFTAFTTDQFTVVGKVFALAPVGAAGRVTFKRNVTGAGTIDFLMPKQPGAVSAQAVGVGTPLPGEPIVLTLSAGIGFFKATVPITAADVLPEQVSITFNLGAVGETTEAFPLTEKPSLLLMLPPKKKQQP